MKTLTFRYALPPPDLVTPAFVRDLLRRTERYDRDVTYSQLYTAYTDLWIASLNAPARRGQSEWVAEYLEEQG